MKRTIIAICFAFISSVVFAQETKETKEVKTEKKSQEQVKTESSKTSNNGQDKVEVKKDVKVVEKDKGGKVERTVTTKQVKKTTRLKQPHELKKDSLKRAKSDMK